LIGQNYSEFGERFPSMHDSYNKKFINLLNQIALEKNIKLHIGVYCGLLGPSLETRAECKMLKTLGADMVGMSTVLEVIVGNYLGLKISAISSITNMSNLFHSESHKQSDIEKYAKKSQENLIILISNFINHIYNYGGNHDKR